MRSTYRRYDPRLRNLVATSGDIGYFIARGVPMSTARHQGRPARSTFMGDACPG